MENENETEQNVLQLPAMFVNPNGWGPVSDLKLFNGMPYHHFNKNDRLGMVSGSFFNLFF